MVMGGIALLALTDVVMLYITFTNPSIVSVFLSFVLLYIVFSLVARYTLGDMESSWKKPRSSI